MSVVRTVVKNTFLTLVEEEDAFEVTPTTRRTKSADPILLTDQIEAREHVPAEKVTGLKTVMSTSSVSTMASESDTRSESSPRESRVRLGASLKHVWSTSSMSSLAEEDQHQDSPCVGLVRPGELRKVQSTNSMMSLEDEAQSQACEDDVSVTRFVESLCEAIWGTTPPLATASSQSCSTSNHRAKHLSTAPPSGPPTTMMIRNIPNRYSQQEFIEELECMGLAGSYDFAYLPLDLNTMGNLGYAFVNFTSAPWAERCRLVLEGYAFTKYQRSKRKVATVSTAYLQGLQANCIHAQGSAGTGRSSGKRSGPVVLTHTSIPAAR